MKRDRGEFFKTKTNVSRPSNPPDELAQNVLKQILFGRIILFFLRKFRILPCSHLLHDSNSIFRAAGINSEGGSGGTVSFTVGVDKLTSPFTHAVSRTDTFKVKKSIESGCIVFRLKVSQQKDCWRSNVGVFLSTVVVASIEEHVQTVEIFLLNHVHAS